MFPVFAWPIPLAIVIWFIARLAGYESRQLSGALFFGALALGVLILVIGLVREKRGSLNDRAGK